MRALCVESPSFASRGERGAGYDAEDTLVPAVAAAAAAPAARVLHAGCAGGGGGKPVEGRMGVCMYRCIRVYMRLRKRARIRLYKAVSPCRLHLHVLSYLPPPAETCDCTRGQGTTRSAPVFRLHCAATEVVSLWSRACWKQKEATTTTTKKKKKKKKKKRKEEEEDGECE